MKSETLYDLDPCSAHSAVALPIIHNSLIVLLIKRMMKECYKFVLKAFFQDDIKVCENEKKLLFDHSDVLQKARYYYSRRILCITC